MLGFVCVCVKIELATLVSNVGVCSVLGTERDCVLAVLAQTLFQSKSSLESDAAFANDGHSFVVVVC